jgi:hypothetical protein
MTPIEEMRQREAEFRARPDKDTMSDIRRDLERRHDD